MGVDNTTILPSGSSGRNSIWIQSQEAYTQYLLIIDAEHVPGNDCGSWPAFWSVNESNDIGEIDIIKYSNSQDYNDVTLYTQNPCQFSPRDQTGTINNNNCDQNEDPAGCDTYGGLVGTDFNNGGGGVYATVWTSAAIQVYFWPRNEIPGDVSAGAPDPSTWGTPLADFEQANDGCNIDQNWLAQTIQIDTNFCGSSTGGDAWTSDPVCSLLAPTCEEYVAGNPAAFDDAFWLINYVKVYQAN